MHPFHAVAGGKAQHLAQAFFATQTVSSLHGAGKRAAMALPIPDSDHGRIGRYIVYDLCLQDEFHILR